MQCKAVKEYLPFYYYNDLDKTITLEIKSHINSCGDCKTELKYLKRTLELVNKEEKINLPLAYRRTLINKILEATNLKKERRIFVQRRSAFVFGSSFAIAIILFFSFFSSLRIPDSSLNWQNNSFAYKVEELNKKMSNTNDRLLVETGQFSDYGLNEKAENISAEIEELIIFSEIKGGEEI